MTPTAATGLLERDAEHEFIADLLVAATRAEGGLVVLEGEAGIGKTALLRHARATAERNGLTTLQATASPLDRDYPFGLVLQLLGPVVEGADDARREALFAGAAARARAVLLHEAEDAAASHALLHGLYWLCANAAEHEPLLLLVDDLHWGDQPSLRFLEFLGRRLDGLAVAVVAAVRPAEPHADAELLAAIAQGPAARVATPSPLTATGTRELLTDALGATPDGAFVDACRAATGGNPLLLGELARAAAADRLTGAAEEADRARALGSESVAAHVERRLQLLGGESRMVARCAAVTGDRGRVDVVAAAAGVGPDALATAAERLAGAGILEPGGWCFAHPLVREAVLARIPGPDLSRLHELAAADLESRGARAPEIAAHILATAPSGNASRVEVLRAAARVAAADGALATAVACLRRALEEPPAAELRPQLLLELGELEAAHGVSRAPERLEAALEAGLHGDDAVRARAARARQAMLRDPATAVKELQDAAARAEEPSLRLGLQSLLLDVTAYQGGFDDLRAELLRAGGDDEDASPVMLAHLAQDAAYRSAPAADVVALARRAIADEALLRAPGQPGASYHLLIMALRHAEQPDLAAEVIAAGEAAARRQGSRLAMYFIDHARAYWELMFGSVTVAEAHAREALRITEEAALPLGRVSLAAMLAEVLIERGAIDEAEEHVRSVALTPELEQTIPGSDLLGVRAELHRLRRRLDDAEADARRARELVRARGWTTPLKSLGGARLALALADAGRRDDAVAAAEQEIAAATRAQTPGVAAALERLRGRALGGEEGLAVLEDAIAALEGSALALDRAWALYDLGTLRRRAGRPTDAREPLRRALDEATRIGAMRLAELAREELLAAGARPRREALKGPESLTPSERRVADLAVQGMTNREIAEALWVTRKTVELHLGSAYAKLGIRSRQQLAAALG